MILNLIPVPECDPLTVNGGLEIKLVGDLVTTQLYLYTRDILTIKQKMSDPINPQGQEPSSGPRQELFSSSQSEDLFVLER